VTEEMTVATTVTGRLSQKMTGQERQHDDNDVVYDIDQLSVLYGSFRAVRDATLQIRNNEITAFIGPSGCGKTTVLRCLNRMNDFIESAKVEGKVMYHGVDLYDPAVNSTEVRRRVGMVFQKPNPFPKSIYDNVAYGPRLAGMKKRAERPVSACPAVNSSDSASLGPWRSHLRSSSWMSRARRSTPSRQLASKT
jgi:ABC-type Fe3+/spermidine/putrescine transport system ATPase subunit